ncbi:MAG: thiol-disulfide oxidoreductase DCC family protein [Janthinobacterium lividum]
MFDEKIWQSSPHLDLATDTILFDGACVLCSQWFRFVAERDPHARFRFAAVQGPTGRKLAESLGIDPDSPETNAVVIEGRAYFRSDAAIEVLRRLPGWRWTPLLRVVPRSIRNRLYDAIARNRYALFGRMELCLVPTPELQRHLVQEPSK